MAMTPEECRKYLAKLDPFVDIDKSCTSQTILPVPNDITDHSPQSCNDRHEMLKCSSSGDEGFREWQDVQLLTNETECGTQQFSGLGAQGSSRSLTSSCVVTATCTSSTLTVSGSPTDVKSQVSFLGEHVAQPSSRTGAQGSSRNLTSPCVMTATCTSSTLTVSGSPSSSMGNACSKSIGPFQNSGLPDYLKGSWANAQTIIDRNRVGRFPGSPESKRVVISLSQGDTCHVVTISRSRVLQCDEKCPKFGLDKLCAHTIAVAFECGIFL